MLSYARLIKIIVLLKVKNDMFGQRQGIIVWLHSLKHAKMLRRFGNVHYVSKRLKYVVLYCNLEETEMLIEKLQSFSFVKKVEPSYKPFLKMEFENSKPDKAKEYDYKMGI
jgi:uncharacterized protein YlbG (UPF0298 family)